MDHALVLHAVVLTGNFLLFLFRSIITQSMHAHNQPKNLHEMGVRFWSLPLSSKLMCLPAYSDLTNQPHTGMEVLELLIHF